MQPWLIVVVTLTALLVLDATVGRQLLRLTTTFRKTEIPGFTPGSKKLMVYLPGILFDGDESVAEIKDSMLENVAGGLFVSYGFWRFLPKQIINKTAKAIGHTSSEDPNQQYDSIVMVGASFGGRLAADLCVELRTQYGWDASAIKVILVDTPCENNSFQTPGLTASLIMKRLYIGPLVSLFARLFIKFILEPPHDEDIEPHLDFKQTKKLAVRRMAKFSMTTTADQQRYLADNMIQWTMGLSGIDVVYLWCDYNNITVVQPAAMRKIEMYTEEKVARFTWHTVHSPHCGFAQMPRTWRKTFRQVIN